MQAPSSLSLAAQPTARLRHPPTHAGVLPLCAPVDESTASNQSSRSSRNRITSGIRGSSGGSSCWTPCLCLHRRHGRRGCRSHSRRHRSHRNRLKGRVYRTRFSSSPTSSRHTSSHNAPTRCRSPLLLWSQARHPCERWHQLPLHRLHMRPCHSRWQGRHRLPSTRHPLSNRCQCPRCPPTGSHRSGPRRRATCGLRAPRR